MAKAIVAANWKMNGSADQALAWLQALASDIEPCVESLICPPALVIGDAAFRDVAAGVGCGIAGQDCHSAASGAYTGWVSAPMLAELGVRHCVVGHSERRAYAHEGDAEVKAKASSCLESKVTPIICIGESLGQREAGLHLQVVKDQLLACLPERAASENTVVAYEPIWAIGTGKVASVTEIIEMHAMLADALIDRGLAGLRLQYGGSVKPSNAQEIAACANVDGALVGGASLDAKDFGPILKAFAKA